MRTAAITIGLLIGLAGAASAQSLYGPGGLFLLPTAAVPEQGRVTPALLVLPQHNPEAHSTRTWESVSVDYGATDDLEIGATYLKVAGWDRNASAGGYAKYRFLRAERDGRPQGAGLDAAAGFTVLGGGDVDAQVGFLALRRPVQLAADRSLVGHLGVEYLGTLDGISRHEWQPYAGVELGLVPRLVLAGEARPRGRGDFETPFALTLVYRYGAANRLALTWANNGLSDHPMFGFGAGLTIGGRR
jgi:hypothetical protein